uniref:Replication factor A C-terminal domain-containing protein n=1 Tax=Lotus japonicus TaxID=34305 RepID=I3S020_LOTJA|nr:unknown [Lotus japonicus]
MFFCENCVCHMVLPIPRYKLQVRVVDTTESTTFVIFDQEAYVLLNKPCATLVKDPTKDPTDFEVPADVLELIDQTFLFKIEVNNSSNSIFKPSYRVKKICSDSDFMCQFQASLPSIEGSAPLLIMGTPISVLKGESSFSSIVKDLNAEFVNAGNSNAVETFNSPVVGLSSDTQRSSPVPSDPTPKLICKHDMTLKR